MLMKLSKLLASRQSILRQAHLATLAHAFVTTKRLADRVATAKLRGPVRLQPADPRDERYWPALTALEGNQSVLEEHFSDEDLVHLADAAVLALETEFTELNFHLEDLGEKLVAPLRAALDEADITLDPEDEKQPNVTAKNNE
jgi:predicted metal-dependent hydrolase